MTTPNSTARSDSALQGGGDNEAFKREGRYIVIKKKLLTPVQLSKLKTYLRLAGIAEVGAVVVERDWPEYEPVWQMIEKRVAGGAK